MSANPTKKSFPLPMLLKHVIGESSSLTLGKATSYLPILEDSDMCIKARKEDKISVEQLPLIRTPFLLSKHHPPCLGHHPILLTYEDCGFYRKLLSPDCSLFVAISCYTLRHIGSCDSCKVCRFTGMYIHVMQELYSIGL